jgi:hypothetical protein
MYSTATGPKSKPPASVTAAAAFESNTSKNSANDEPSMNTGAHSKKRSSTDFVDHKNKESQSDVKRRCQNHKGVTWSKSDSKYAARIWSKVDKKTATAGLVFACFRLCIFSG